MADRVRFGVYATPIETLTDENSGTHDIISGEVGKSFAGGGDSINLTDYSGTAANQGYKDGAVNYKDITHSAGGTQISSTVADFIYVKNTGHKFSSATVLGDSTTDCIMIVAKMLAFSESVNGGYTGVSATPYDSFIEIAWLKPNQSILLPLSASNLTITQFGSTATDLINLNGDTDKGGCYLFARTFQSDGSAATDGNALEYLVVT